MNKTESTEILTQKHKPVQEHKYSFDEVFGISLTEYLNLHGKSIHALICEQEIDIIILESNYKRVSDLIKESTLDTESKEIKYKLDLAQEIKAKVLKKKSHLERLNEFRKQIELESYFVDLVCGEDKKESIHHIFEIITFPKKFEKMSLNKKGNINIDLRGANNEE